MTRNYLNYIVDALSGIAMLGLIATGLVMHWVLPPGSGNSRVLWTLGRHDWGDLHFWISIGIIGLMLVHVGLHWKWVSTTSRRLLGRSESGQHRSIFRMQNLVGIGSVIVLSGLCVTFVNIAQKSVTSEGGGRGRQESLARADSVVRTEAAESRGNLNIRGSITLAEAAIAVGLPVETVKLRLGIAASEPTDSRLGQLRQRYDFDMSDVRALANPNKPVTK